MGHRHPAVLNPTYGWGLTPPVSRRYRTANAITTVCRLWHDIGKKHLYQNVVFYSASQVYPFLQTLRSDTLRSESNRPPLGPLVRSLLFCPLIPTGLEREVALCINEILTLCPRLENVQMTFKGPWNWPTVHGFECFISTVERVASQTALKELHLDFTQTSCIPLPLRMRVYTLLSLTLAIPNVAFISPNRDNLVFPQLKTLVFVVKSPSPLLAVTNGNLPADLRGMRWDARMLIAISKCVDAPNLRQLTLCADRFLAHPRMLENDLLEVVRRFGKKLRYLHIRLPTNDCDFQLLVEACPELEHLAGTLATTAKPLRLPSHSKLMWIDIWVVPFDPSLLDARSLPPIPTLASFQGFRLLDDSLALLLDLPLLLPPDGGMKQDETRLVTLPGSIDVVQTIHYIAWQDPCYASGTDEDPDYEPSEDDDTSDECSSFGDELVDFSVTEDAEGIIFPPRNSDWEDRKCCAEAILRDVRPLLPYFGGQVRISVLFRPTLWDADHFGWNRVEMRYRILKITTIDFLLHITRSLYTWTLCSRTRPSSCRLGRYLRLSLQGITFILYSLSYILYMDVPYCMYSNLTLLCFPASSR